MFSCRSPNLPKHGTNITEHRAGLGAGLGAPIGSVAAGPRSGPIWRTFLFLAFVPVVWAPPPRPPAPGYLYLSGTEVEPPAVPTIMDPEQPSLYSDLRLRLGMASFEKKDSGSRGL